VIDPKRIWSSSQLPTLPSVAVRLLELARDPETEFKTVIDVVKTDPAITAKILKSANSSFFGFKAPVTSIERAVPLLGTTVVTTLALSFSLVDAAMSSGPLAQHYSAYWKQSIVQAVAAEVIAEQHAPGISGECFLTGLLLDLGRLAMLKTVAKDYLPVLIDWQEKGGSLNDLELARLGVDHVGVGMQLMRDWRLPAGLIQAVSLQHAPLEQILDELQGDAAAMDRAVTVAAAVGDYLCTIDKASALERLKALASAFYRQDEAQLEAYLKLTRERIDRAGVLFSVDFGELGDSADFMAEANEQLARLAVKEHMASTQMEIQREAVEHQNQELESKNQELQQLAMRDPLTLLYNRTFFAEALSAAIQAASRTAAPVGVLFTDIDRFKSLNDTYGHAFGDEVLRGVARVLTATLRKSDVLARYGGEEFVVLVHQPTEKGLGKLGERLRASVENACFAFDGKPVVVTVSVGAAMALPERDPGELALRIVAAADEAMYDAKQYGRNQVHLRSLVEPHDRELAQLVAQKRFSRWLVQNNALDIPTVSRALLETRSDRLRIGSLAQLFGFLTAEQLDEVRRRQTCTGERFGRCAVACGYLSNGQLATLLAVQAEPPNLLARTLTNLGVINRERADALLAEYRDWLSCETGLSASIV
jgi:diguanylate cyclase (GGDEF)-like protein